MRERSGLKSRGVRCIGMRDEKSKFSPHFQNLYISVVVGGEGGSWDAYVRVPF